LPRGLVVPRLGPLLDLAHGPRGCGRLASVRSPTRCGKDLKPMGRWVGQPRITRETAVRMGPRLKMLMRPSWPGRSAVLLDRISAGWPTRLTWARRHRDPRLAAVVAAVAPRQGSQPCCCRRRSWPCREVGVGDEQRPQRGRGRRWRRDLRAGDLRGPGVLLAAGRHRVGAPAGGHPGPVLAAAALPRPRARAGQAAGGHRPGQHGRRPSMP
jgi:hypothetical protein